MISDETMRRFLSRPAPTPAAGPITKRVETEAECPRCHVVVSPAPLPGETCLKCRTTAPAPTVRERAAVMQLDEELEEAGVFRPEAPTVVPERIPPRPLTVPPRVGRHGRTPLYSAKQKTTTSIGASEDLKALLMRARLPSDDSLEDTIRRLCGFPARTII